MSKETPRSWKASHSPLPLVVEEIHPLILFFFLLLLLSLTALIKSGTLSDRRSSIDLLDGLDLDFLGNTLGDSFDGFEFDG